MRYGPLHLEVLDDDFPVNPFVEWIAQQ